MTHAVRIASPFRPSVRPAPAAAAAGALTDGVTVWFTGLSGAGKSTLASAVAELLRADAVPVELLDGDEVRQHLSKGLGFTRADRDENIRRIGYVARLLTRHGVVVLVAAISPYREAREEVRRSIGEGRFVEVFVNASVEECARRDVKGLYSKAFAGVITAFTGVSDPYEPPLSPDLVIDTERETVADGAARVVTELRARGHLHLPDDAPDAG
jgi:adenylyl-sulfate kinase